MEAHLIREVIKSNRKSDGDPVKESVNWSKDDNAVVLSTAKALRGRWNLEFSTHRLYAHQCTRTSCMQCPKFHRIYSVTRVCLSIVKTCTHASTDMVTSESNLLCCLSAGKHGLIRKAILSRPVWLLKDENSPSQPRQQVEKWRNAAIMHDASSFEFLPVKRWTFEVLAPVGDRTGTLSTVAMMLLLDKNLVLCCKFSCL